MWNTGGRFPPVAWVECECGCGEGVVLDDVAQFCVEEALRTLVDGAKLHAATRGADREVEPLPVPSAHERLGARHRQAMGG